MSQILDETAACAAIRAIIGAKMPLQECFVVLCLDAKNRVQYAEIVAMGSATTVEVHPRDIFRAAIRENAVSVIVGHNHPSGDTRPSGTDRLLTERLQAAAEIVGVPLLDHVIVGAEAYKSFAAEGWL